MRKIGNDIFYTTQEIIQKTNIPPSTLFRQIQDKKINTILYLGTHLISENELNRIQVKIEEKKHDIVIIKHDIVINENDSTSGILHNWVSKKDNLLRLRKWAEGTYTDWNNMNSEDYLAYYKFLIFPVWRKNGGLIHIKPSNQWLIEHGFKSFVDSFVRGYLKSEGIDTIKEFFEKIIFK